MAKDNINKFKIPREKLPILFPDEYEVDAKTKVVKKKGHFVTPSSELKNIGAEVIKQKIRKAEGKKVNQPKGMGKIIV